MDKGMFRWNLYGCCWESLDIEDTKIFIHTYPSNQYLESIQKNGLLQADHFVFDSIHAVHKFIELKYNGLVNYRDPQEVNHPRRDLLEQYI